jgi:hypothetical protein
MALSRVGPNTRQRQALEDQEREQALVGLLLDRMSKRVNKLSLQLTASAERLNHIPNRNFLIRLVAINDFMKLHLGWEMLENVLSRIPDEDKNLMPSRRRSTANAQVQVSLADTSEDKEVTIEMPVQEAVNKKTEDLLELPQDEAVAVEKEETEEICEENALLN